MKEYEYISSGIENYLVDELVGVICQENLRCIPYPDGFRRIFDNYVVLRKEFQKEITDRGTSEIPASEEERIVDGFANIRSQILEAFLIDLEKNYPLLDVRGIAADYFNQAYSEKTLTTSRRVCVYPHLAFRAMQFNERML